MLYNMFTLLQKSADAFFHLSQCIYRKVQALGLSNDYVNDENLRLQVKILPALAFVPINDVIDAFEELQLDNRLTALVDYFEDTFIGRERRRRRAAPLFPIQMWNVHDKVEEGLPKTNNSVEGWHRAFNRLVAGDHPSPFVLVDVIRREQNHTENQLAQLEAGREVVENRKAKYVQLARRLQTLVDRYDSNEKTAFLRGVAHNIDL